MREGRRRRKRGKEGPDKQAYNNLIKAGSAGTEEDTYNVHVKVKNTEAAAPLPDKTDLSCKEPTLGSVAVIV